ncbi:MAG: hypothetical protein GEV07_22855 [Streptosporangiales bacterium]|nr:hypothetical protein [Streptosporangiales bacterium]
MDGQVVVRPPVVAAWGRHTEDISAELSAVPGTLAAAVAALDEAGAGDLAGAWAVAAFAGTAGAAVA